jgi:hypothetical protein
MGGKRMIALRVYLCSSTIVILVAYACCGEFHGVYRHEIKIGEFAFSKNKAILDAYNAAKKSNFTIFCLHYYTACTPYIQPDGEKECTENNPFLSGVINLPIKIPPDTYFTTRNYAEWYNTFIFYYLEQNREQLRPYVAQAPGNEILPESFGVLSFKTELDILNSHNDWIDISD